MAVIPREPSQEMIKYYRVGASLRAQGRVSMDEVWSDVFGWWQPSDADDWVDVAWFEAGIAGREMPKWVTGWRYGSVPTRGLSYNYRDERCERGVSMMQIDGECDQTDGTFALFNSARPRVRVGGWLIEARGSDGEPLVVGAVELSGPGQAPQRSDCCRRGYRCRHARQASHRTRPCCRVVSA